MDTLKKVECLVKVQQLMTSQSKSKYSKPTLVKDTEIKKKPFNCCCQSSKK